MKISIITPSFNQGHFIEETIKSVLYQKHSNLEYIIVDGGSTDGTLNTLKKYEGKLRWTSEKDNGQSEAINKGIQMATGDIISFLNSDDQYFPYTLYEVVTFFKKNPHAYWVTGDYYIIDAKGKRIRSYVRWYKKFLRYFSSLFTLSVANYVIQPSTFWRRDVLETIGLFDESLQYDMDYDYWLRLGKKYRLYAINRPLSLFRLHGSSKSGLHYRKQFDEEIKVLKKNNIPSYNIYLHIIHSTLVLFIYNLLSRRNC